MFFSGRNHDSAFRIMPYTSPSFDGTVFEWLMCAEISNAVAVPHMLVRRAMVGVFTDQVHSLSVYLQQNQLQQSDNES